MAPMAASSGILRKVYEATPAFNPRQRSPPAAAGGSAISAAASRVTGIDATIAAPLISSRRFMIPPPEATRLSPSRAPVPDVR
jgi:hypothetical protein